MARVAVTAVLAYGALLFLLRLSGKRTLSKLTAFDLVVTVALGSTLATVIVSKDVALVDGLLALALLIGLQYVVAWVSVRATAFHKLVKNEPTLLFYEGTFLDITLRRARIRRDEVLAAIRGQGVEGLADLRAVVLETDGTLSVVRGRGARPPDSTLSSVAESSRSAA
jgi:uncharacterized membrane protein YcaP (DUF421 family)